MKISQTQSNKPLALGMLAIIAFLGGTDIASAQTPDRISVKSSTALSREGGSNVGGGNDSFGVGSIDPWADGIVDTLITQETIATQAFADGSTLLAISHYKSGLEQILVTASSSQNRMSWTYKTAERALELSNRLEATVAEIVARDPLADREKLLKAIMTTLSSNYQLIEKYYYSLDVQFYTPYRQACGRPNATAPYNLEKFEEVLLNYSLKQITWFQSNYVLNSTIEGTLPRYSDKFFLITLASVARGLSNDVGADINNPNPILFPLAYAQASRSLSNLANQIEQHLAGNGIFGNNKRAVNFTYDRLTQIVGYINGLKR